MKKLELESSDTPGGLGTGLTAAVQTVIFTWNKGLTAAHASAGEDKRAVT